MKTDISEDFQAVFETLPGSHLILKPNLPTYTIVGVSDDFLKGTFTTRENLVGKGVFEAFSDNLPEAGSTIAEDFHSSLESVLKKKKMHMMKMQKYSVKVPEKNELLIRYWNFLNIPVLKNEEVEYIIHHLEDVTDKVVSAEAIRDDKAQLKYHADNLEYLSEASKLLSSSLDYQTTLRSVGELAVPKIADWCSIDILDDSGGIQQVAVAHADPKKVEWAKEHRQLNPPDLSSPTGLSKVLRTATSEYYPVITDEMLVASSKSKKELKLARSLNIKSAMTVPIVTNKKAIGAITFITTDTNRYYTKNDLKMAEELSNRASLAIENARLYQAAQDSEIKFKAFVDSNIVGVFTAIKDGTIIEANEGFLKIIGYTRDDLENGKLNRWKLTPFEYKKGDEQAMKELKKLKSATPWEKEYFKKDGSQVPVIVASTMVNEKNGLNITIVLDITERKRLEQRKDEFIGIASHELKTPLTSIKGYVQILERIITEMGNDRATVLVNKTNTYINRLNSLISDLLDVSKIQSGKIQFNKSEFNIRELLLESIEAFQPTSLKHVLICSECKDFTVYGDRNRLEQVISNLLSNAIKYSPDADKVEVSMESQNEDIIIRVTDYGIGIPKNQHNKLFQRFYRVQKNAKQFSGLGIGLYISAEIIKRHDGTIGLESKEGKGSTFYFTLPIKN